MVLALLGYLFNLIYATLCAWMVSTFLLNPPAYGVGVGFFLAPRFISVLGI